MWGLEVTDQSTDFSSTKVSEPGERSSVPLRRPGRGLVGYPDRLRNQRWCNVGLKRKTRKTKEVKEVHNCGSREGFLERRTLEVESQIKSPLGWIQSPVQILFCLLVLDRCLPWSLWSTRLREESVYSSDSGSLPFTDSLSQVDASLSEVEGECV